VQQSVVAAVSKLRTRYDGYQLVTTGHSLGAALAVFAAIDLAWVNHFPVSAVYNFGSPRLGNDAFAKWMQEHVLANIPHLPCCVSWGASSIW
jgi:predicted lipase